MSRRIRGQEVTILIVRDAALEAELTDIKNFTAELMTEIISKGYLGEDTEQKDEIYKGTKFSFEMDNHSPDFLTFSAAVIDRAKRRTPDTVFNISAVLAFPDGRVATVLFPDAKFGPQPINVPERGDYVSIKYEGEVSNVSIAFQ